MEYLIAKLHVITTAIFVQKHPGSIKLLFFIVIKSNNYRCNQNIFCHNITILWSYFGYTREKHGIAYTVELRYFEFWYIKYNGYVICKSKPLVFRVYYPKYIEYFDITKF